MNPSEPSPLRVFALNPPPPSPRFEVGCEGEFLADFTLAREALVFARRLADFTGCPHDILDAATRTALFVIEPLPAESLS